MRNPRQPRARTLSPATARLPARSPALALCALAACSAEPPAPLAPPLAPPPLPAPPLLPSFEGLLPTADGRLWVRCAGRGPDVVLLHGLGDNAGTWHRLEDRLRECGFRVTAIDSLGAGRSDKPAGPYGIDAHVARLCAVCDRLAIERPVLVGNSLGGTFALRCAQLHPQRVRALVLISPGAFPEGGWTSGWWWNLPGLDGWLERVPPTLVARTALAINFGEPARIQPADVARYAREAARPGVFAALVRQQQQLLPPPEVVARWIEGYAAIDRPALVLWGTKDRVLDPAQGERLAAALPHARLIPLQGLGHAAQLEAPETVLAELRPFLREVTRQPR